MVPEGIKVSQFTIQEMIRFTRHGRNWGLLYVQGHQPDARLARLCRCAFAPWWPGKQDDLPPYHVRQQLLRGLKFQFLMRVGLRACLCSSDADPRGKWYGHLMLGNSCLSPICRWPAAQQNILHHDITLQISIQMQVPSEMQFLFRAVPLQL